MRRGTVQIWYPGFVRSGFQAIDWDSAKVETLRYHHECIAPMVAFAPMGRAPSPTPFPKAKSHHGPLPGESPGRARGNPPHRVGTST
ncbi:protein of unknown function [Methanoculleus bourgensis]|uniref:Uncharacterized protein n=1 Tax=Methanoculleus bourgensis TaxID=83986 RepID=A0A0X3BP92_9EURY|nr:protein of unknown function [Methanoculleus bourgensis]